MYKHLYDCFKHWYNKGSIYIISDTHFSDEESYRFRFPEEFDLDDLDDISELTKRTANKVTVEHLDNFQIKNINRIVTKNDTLIILGDVGNIECVKKLRAGYKVLILGNHDHGASYYKEVFDEVYEGTLQISPRIILSHEPTDYKYCFNIHGHCHNKNYISSGLNCCAEHINYTPINLTFLINSGALKDVPDIHKETIDKRNNR